MTVATRKRQAQGLKVFADNGKHKKKIQQGGEIVKSPTRPLDAMVSLPPILDVCCGGKMFWYNKENPLVLYVDNRYCAKGHNPYRPNHEVKPDAIMDFRKLDLPDNKFKMVVFDPPHFKSKSDKLNIAKLYGHLNPETWREDLRSGFAECMRVLEPNGFLIFKWNETSIKIKDIINIFPCEPLFGNKQGTKLKTHWIVFIKAAS